MQKCDKIEFPEIEKCRLAWRICENAIAYHVKMLQATGAKKRRIEQ